MKDELRSAYAVTIRMPWAHLIAWGYVQDLAIMRFVPAYQGPLIIHAGVEWDLARIDRINGIMQARSGMTIEREDIPQRTKDEGKFQSIVRLVDHDGETIREGRASQFTALVDLGKCESLPGLGTLWPMSNIRPLPLVSARGWPALWKPHDKYIERMIDAVYGSLDASVD